MAKLCCMSTELKSLAYRGSCAQVQKLKNLNCAFCAALLLVEEIVAAAGRQAWFCVAF